MNSYLEQKTFDARDIDKISEYAAVRVQSRISCKRADYDQESSGMMQQVGLGLLN